MRQVKIYFYVKKYAIIPTLLGLILSLFVLYTPKAKDKTHSSFSAVRAMEHIEVISRKPHSYYDQIELEEVRVYIEETLGDYLGNLNVSRHVYDKVTASDKLGVDLDYDLVNIMGKLQGESDKGIMLVAHYDSRGHVGRSGELGRSYGAMDDGYGVGTILELAYILKDLNPKNSVYFLFTDAEEVGLYGAKMAAEDALVMGNIRFVINLESRGRYGPAYMFETSKNNKKVIDLYKKAKLPVTYSMATAVYSVMPNFTDFTPFVNEGYPGLNFAVLAGIENYHSPLDSYENINPSSIQHMGVQVEPVVKEFISNSKYIQDGYFNANSDQVFFTLFAGILISYSKVFSIILMVLLLIGFILYLILVYKKEYDLKDTFIKVLPKGILLTLGLVVLGYLFSRIIAFIFKVPFSLTYTRVENKDYLTLLFMILVIAIYKIQVKKVDQNKVIISGVTINLLLTVITTLILPGASFLFAFAALFGLVGLFIEFVNKKWIKHIVYAVSYIFLLLIIIPLLYSFYMALTVGGLAILVLLMLIMASVLVPVMNKQFHLEKVKDYLEKEEILLN